MYKHFKELTTLMTATLIVLSACTATINETAGKNQCEITPPSEPVACTMQYDPVCGCDGVTYGNACMARGAGVSSNTPGACEEDEAND